MAWLTDLKGANGSGAFGYGGTFGRATINDAAGAVSDLFAADAHESKAQGDRFESQNYLLAAGLADQNEKYTELSTGIKVTQLNRDLYKSMGETTADVAGAGFATSGSALDLLADSANQGALTKQVTQQQGIITEAGYTEQAESYRTMSTAALMAADAEDHAATGARITGAIKGVAALATLL